MREEEPLLNAIFCITPLFIFYVSVEAATNNSLEADTLLSFKQQIVQSSGEHLLHDWNANSKPVVCSWTGVTCNEENLVSGIDLSSQKLGGASADITVNIAPLLEDLTGLAYLNLSSNLLHGSIPQQLRSCSSIVTLDLSSNFFIGSIPSSIAKCSSLQTLSLSRNNLTGPVNPRLANCSRLKNLDLSENILVDEVPSELGLLLHELEDINLSSNNLTGSIPSELGQLRSLQVLDFSNNQLVGHVPSTLGNCSKLTSLILEKNELTGSIPPELGSLANMQVLNLNMNNLIGTLPPSLANCSELVYLYVYGNELSGQVPSELGMLQKVETFFFDLNQFTGPIPPSLSNCSALSRILFYNNSFTGGLPPELGRIKNLFTLELSLNSLTGRITFELGMLRNLAYLSFGGNDLHGSIPSSVTNCTKLINMDFSDNHFTGNIPRGIGYLRNLMKIKMHYNQLTGEIPPDIGKLGSQLQGMFLQSNKLEGTIPAELSLCKSLVELDLSNNMLNGTIPSSLCDLSELQHFNLSHNVLTGDIADCLGTCFRLNMLDFSSNMLTGTIPASVAGLTGMALGFLLSNNMLQGKIPQTIGSMIMVQRIDLSGNDLSGEIPQSIATCVQLQELDLSANKLGGLIPTALGKLADLQGILNLSHNYLQGSIPTELQKLNFLAALDLSNNNLSGEIPSFLTGMPNLKSLNLSNNDMVGPIPSTGIFLNITASSVLGNPKLCGQIIGKSCHRSRRALVLALAIGGSILLLLMMLSLLWCFCKRQHVPGTPGQATSFLQHRSAVVEFSVSDIFRATNGYASDNIIGVGADTIVYRATLRDGKLVAVKNFKYTNAGRDRDTFIRELYILGKIRHRNLIKTLGYCCNMSIVLEYMPNGSLEKHLREKPPKLTWMMRLNIALGVAQALAYLHHDCLTPMVHCDLKPSNILLDSDFEARVADFGISRAVEPANSMEVDIISLTFRGTLGYIPPEYSYQARPSTKGDVYSFGVILLELITGRSPTSSNFPQGSTLPNWVSSVYPHQALHVVDGALQQANRPQDINAVLQTMTLALLCTSYNHMKRPEMKDVVGILTRIKHGSGSSTQHSMSRYPTLEELANTPTLIERLKFSTSGSTASSSTSTYNSETPNSLSHSLQDH